MDKCNDNKSTGLNGLNGESKTEFLRLIWNGTSDQMCLAKMVFDNHGAPADYIILDINPAYEKAFGFARDQAINKRLTELFPYCDPRWIEKCGEAVRSGKSLVSVEHILEPCLWYEVQVFPLGPEDLFITIAQDITGRNKEKIRMENAITSHKIANETLIERVELMNVLMDYNPSLVFLKDECGRYVYINKTHEQLVGSKDWYGKTDFDFWSKESAELFRANDLAVLETGQVTQYIEDSKDLGGTRYCWLNNKFPYTDAKNRKYLAGVSIDVTERILAEEALRKAEEELKLYVNELKRKEEESLELIDSFTEGSWIVDHVAGTIKCSEKWAKRIGLDLVPEEERLSFMHTLSHPDDTAGGNSIQYYMEAGAARFDLEYRIKTVDRGYIWTKNRGKIVYNGQGEVVKIYAATFDITERKRAEEALRESEASYRTIIDTTQEGIWDMDPQFLTLRVNQAMADMLGYSIGDMVGRPAPEFLFMEDIQEHVEHQAQRSQGFSDNYEFRLKHKDGTARWTWVSATPKMGSDGKYAGSFAMFTDITERKRAEEALRESEDRFRALVAASSDVVYRMSPGWDEMYYLQGRDFIPDTCSPNSAWIDKYIHPDDHPRVLEAINEAIRTKSIFQLEHQVMRVDGTLGWMFSRAVPMLDGAGQISEWFGMAKDITARKQVEEILKRNQQQLEELVKERTRELKEANRQKEEILESLSDCFYTLDRNLRFTYVNKGAEEIWGLSWDHLIGNKIEEILPGINELSMSKFRQVLKEKTPQYYEIFSNIIQRWVLINVYPTQDGISVYFRDITERKMAEKALRESEERFSKSFHSSPTIMSLVNLESGLYIDVNETWVNDLGYLRKEIIGRTSADLGIFEDPEQQAEYYRCLNRDQKVNNLELNLRTKKGDLITCITSAELIDLSGERCILCSATNITDKKRIEIEMARLDRLNLVGEMAAGIGHEVRNPMTTVKGFLQLLGEKERYAQDKEYFQLMLEELDRANSIITEFLSLAKNKAVHLQMKNLNKILKSILPLIQADGLVTDKYINLETTKIPDLLLDEKEIRQLVLNLVRNSLEAMLPGGFIIIRTYSEEDEVVLSVQDNGKGIEPEILEKMYTPFFTTKDTGTGLGLPVCYSITARHNARIEVETGSGGTTFFVKFKKPE